MYIGTAMKNSEYGSWLGVMTAAKTTMITIAGRRHRQCDQRDGRSHREQDNRREHKRDRVALLLRIEAGGDEAPELPQPDGQCEHDPAVGGDLDAGQEGVERAEEDQRVLLALRRIRVVRDEEPDDRLRED